MSHLTSSESVGCIDSFLTSLIGRANLKRWKEMKQDIHMQSEWEFVTWLLDVADDVIRATDADTGVMQGEGEGEEVTGDACDPHPPQSVVVKLERYEASTNSLPHMITPEVEVDGYDPHTDLPFVEVVNIQTSSTSNTTDAVQVTEDEGQDAAIESLSDPSWSPIRQQQQLRSEMKYEMKKVLDQNGKVAYKCLICGQLFTFKTALPRHIKSVHLAHKSHECPMCGKLFSRGDILKRHELIHCKKQINYLK